MIVLIVKICACGIIQLSKSSFSHGTCKSDTGISSEKICEYKVSIANEQIAANAGAKAW